MCSSVAVISFSKDYEADTALFLDHGMVCGGPIEVCKYKDLSTKLPDAQRHAVEKLAKQLLETVDKNPQQEKQPEAETKQVEISEYVDYCVEIWIC